MAEYKISEGNAEAIVSDIGGTVLSFKVAGKDIIYPWRRTDDGKERGGIPICAPWFGSAPEFGERKHGHLRELKADKVSYINDSSLEMVFEHPGSQGYPWAMEYILKVSVKRKTLSVSIQTKRLDDGIFNRAPINPGFHPYFLGNEKNVLVSTSGFETFSGFSKESKSFSAGGSIIAIVQSYKNSIRRTIIMRLAGDFSENSVVVFWSDNPEEYFCVEPVLEDKKVFDGPDGHLLHIGESVVISMSISLP